MEQKLSVLRTVLESDEIKPTGGTACAIAGAAQTSGIKETSLHQAVQEAIIHTTRLRLTIGQNCVRVLDLIDDLGSVADNDFSADRHCARTLATAALQGAIEKAEVYFREIWDDDTAIECGQEIQSLIKEIPDPYTWARGDL